MTHTRLPVTSTCIDYCSTYIQYGSGFTTYAYVLVRRPQLVVLCRRQYVAGLKRELEFSEVVGMTSEPLIPVYTTIITSGKTKQTRSPVVFNEDAGYQVPLSFLKPGWDAADHKVAVQRRGTYDVALAASGSDEQKQTTVAQWMHSEIAAGTARGKSLRTALVAIMTALGVDPNVVLPVEESA